MTALLMLLLAAAAIASGTPDNDRTMAVRLARETLARTLGVAQDRMRVEEVYAVDWSDAALGCPQKGVQYAQAMVPGYSVRLSIGGASHRVNVGGGRAVVCDRAAASDSSKYMQIVVRLLDLARRDLASRLGVAVRDVKALRLQPRTWRDASLGCPERGRSYEKAETKGFLIELEHADKTYRYHSDRERVVFCPDR